ncbi:hypothetical protein KY339_02530, partial [Candidatus Woesearchaeota archaeon]|nr:hypothetical protein [Candidatus Woesearchaeota archaeon]
MTEDNFQKKWKEILAKADEDNYETQVFRTDWEGMPTESLPREAQEHIDSHKQEIKTPSVLVLNHPYCHFLGLTRGQKKPGPKTRDEETYLKNLDRLLTEKDPEKIDIVIFDNPELYVHDSAERLMQKQAQSVVLTEILGGGSLNPEQAKKEIGEGKIIYIAGSHLACLLTTANELRRNNNYIILIHDAAFELNTLVSGMRMSVFDDEEEIPNLMLATTEDFLRTYGRKSFGKYSPKTTPLVEFDSLGEFIKKQNNFYAHFYAGNDWGEHRRKRPYFKLFQSLYPEMERLTTELTIKSKTAKYRTELPYTLLF